jgi:hypothetical protein
MEIPDNTSVARWFRFWTRSREYRRRRAYFRPTDTSALDSALVRLIDSIVTVRFVAVADSSSPFAEQPLYGILSRQPSVRQSVRPGRDFDFLD